jgi:adenylylsulfate kinase
MATRILIMGLPGAGKTTLATALKNHLIDIKHEGYGITVEWFNADDVRKKFNDWDFTETGRIRQSLRMRELADNSKADYVICDFVAPLTEMRNNFKADWTIWLDTIEQGRYEDTNKAFVPPTVYDFRITEQDSDKWSVFIADNILANKRRPVFDWRKETVQMLVGGNLGIQAIAHYLNDCYHAQGKLLFRFVMFRAGKAAIHLELKK